MVKNIIVIPCYNEESRLRVSEFDEFAKDNPDFELLFVNDGSTDKTHKLLYSLCERPNIKSINLKQNVGKAEAVRMAFSNLMFSDLDFDYAGYLDADLSTPLLRLNDSLRLPKQMIN
jgi:dolichyl-phosphate beta-glucosyltransferase